MKKVQVWSASWCPQCGPFKDNLARKGIEFEVLDADELQDKAVELGIRALPTTVIIEDGNEVARIPGPNLAKVMEALQ